MLHRAVTEKNTNADKWQQPSEQKTNQKVLLTALVSALQKALLLGIIIVFFTYMLIVFKFLYEAV